MAVNSLLPNSQLSTPDELEVVTVRIVLNRKVITICTAHIPSNCSDDYKYSLLSYLEDTVSSSETAFIMGDFNLAMHDHSYTTEDRYQVRNEETPRPPKNETEIQVERPF